LSGPLDRLLALLPARAPNPDAELAALGVEAHTVLEAIALRALAGLGPLRLTDIAAWAAAQPAVPGVHRGLKSLKASLGRLSTRGLVEAMPDGRYVLSGGLSGRFGDFAGEGPDGSAVEALPLAQAMAAAHPKTPRPADVPDGATVLRALEVTGDAAPLDAALAGLTPEARALAAWTSPLLSHPGTAPIPRRALTRLKGAAQAALASPPTDAEAVIATWLVLVQALADLLRPAVLDAQPLRREELIRRWAWHAGQPLRTGKPVESRVFSASRMAALDYRRVLADEAAHTLREDARALQEGLLDAERTRRKEAAAQASGRRE
jgi:hypothetical protein